MRDAPGERFAARKSACEAAACRISTGYHRGTQSARPTVAATAGTDIEIQVLLAACLGLRRSEILAMQWDAIDLNGRTIAVRAAMVPDEKGKFVLKGTKTDKSYRTLSAPAYLIARLKTLEHRTDGFLFHTTATTMERHLKEICESSGLPSIGYHALRHTNATMLFELGVEVKDAQDILGHSTAAMTQDIYIPARRPQKENIKVHQRKVESRPVRIREKA